jgi:NADPH:quinone reductase-like Zn-dependent oxidoreductase
MSRFVQYEEFGDGSNLAVVVVQPPVAGPGEVRVKVKVAGLNPVDFEIFRGGPAAESFGVRLPSGVGNDFSGIVDQVGEGVTDFAVGDAVFGGARHAAASDFVVMPRDGLLVRKPEKLSFELAGALAVVGRTAWASVASVNLTPADTVLISAAAGGVGVLASQLAVRSGATVVGTASVRNHEFLRSLGVIPVAYGDAMVERLRAIAPQGYTAALDNHGPDTIRAAIELRIPISRINTIATYGPEALGASNVGGAHATSADLAHMAQLLADGALMLPIDAVYPLQRVSEAYAHLQTGHVRGKIVLVTD